MKTRVIFVGVHNKPDMLPLDSGTKTGKIIDRIIALMNDCHPVKSNLYDIDYYPENRTKALDIEWVHNWMERVMWTDDDVVVTLGHCVNEAFRLAHIQSIKVGHPASVWSHEAQERYVNSVWYKIGLRAAEIVSSTPEKARAYLISEGLDPDKLAAEGVAHVNKIMNTIARENRQALAQAWPTD